MGKGFAQLDLVAKMGRKVDATNISRIEAARTNPTLYTLHRISIALEVPLEDLICIEE